MINVRHKTLIVISGLVWLAVGSSLLMMGLNFLLEGVKTEHASAASYPLLSSMNGILLNMEQAALVLVALGLFIGYFKGKFVLGKSAKQGVARIQGFSNPTALSNIYSAKYYILLGLMIGLGMSMKYVGLPIDVRGLVDVAVGSALINGSMFYFRACFSKECMA
jgi:hypothetical protein